MNLFNNNFGIGRATTTDGMDTLLTSIDEPIDLTIEIEDETDLETFDEMWCENQHLNEDTMICIFDGSEITPCPVDSVGYHRWTGYTWELLSR